MISKSFNNWLFQQHLEMHPVKKKKKNLTNQVLGKQSIYFSKKDICYICSLGELSLIPGSMMNEAYEDQIPSRAPMQTHRIPDSFLLVE